MDEATLACVGGMLPFSLPPGVTALLLFLLDGHPGDVVERSRRLKALCQAGGAGLILEARDHDEAEKLWAARRAISPATFRLRPRKVSEDVAVPLSAIPALVAGVKDLARRRGLPIICFGHAGDGNIHVNIMFDPADSREAGEVKGAVAELFRLVRGLKGTLSGEHGIGLTKAPYLGLELSPAAMALQRRLKQTFDPNNIMNPGKIFPPGYSLAPAGKEQA